MQLGFLGDETAQVGLHRNVVLVIVIQATLRQTLLYRAESLGLLVETDIDRSDVAHVECHRRLGCPTALTIEVGHAQLIYPNDTTLGRGRIVANTDEHYPHLA